MTALEEIIAIAIFGAVTIGAYALLALFDPYWLRVRSRVGALQQGGPHRAANRDAATGGAATRTSAVDLLKRFALFRSSDRRRLHQRFAQAGVYHPAAMNRYFVFKFLLTALPPSIAVVIAAYGYVRMDKAVLAGCLIGGFSSLVPSLWLDRATSRHHLLLRRSLPDFLDLMIVCLEGGLSIQETIRRVGDELRLAHPALAVELEIMQRDVELGATVEQALKRFADRTDYEGVRTLSTFIRETQRFGTNITEALRTHADMLRLQREQAAEETHKKAAVKILLPTLLLIFPAVFVVLVGPAAIQIQEAFADK